MGLEDTEKPEAETTAQLQTRLMAMWMSVQKDLHGSDHLRMAGRAEAAATRIQTEGPVRPPSRVSEPPSTRADEESVQAGDSEAGIPTARGRIWATSSHARSAR